MNKADKYYIENLNRIKNEGCFDENPRPRYKDGTEAYTKFITQVFEEYDISKGEFPIPTLRNTAIKTGIKEILAIYQKQTNTREGFESMGVNWWESWMNENGDIGKAYSYNIESHRVNDSKRLVCKINKRILDVSLGDIKEIKKQKIFDSIDNITYNSNYRNYGDYIIIKEYNKKCDITIRTYVDCQFLNTGYITSIRKDSLKKGQNPKNNLIRTNLNIGYLDNYEEIKNFTKDEIIEIRSIWSRMFVRCYSKYKKEYYENVFVHQDWHSFKNFLKDVRYLPQYNLAKECNFKGWELDKDYYGSNCYSKNTATFLSKKENLLYRRTQVSPIKITEDSNYYYELSYTSLSKTLGLSKGYTRYCVNDGLYKKIKFEKIYDNDNLYRYELSRNQINELLKGLEKDPFGRRHIISLWNWANIDKKELVECAYETLWSVRKIKNEYYLDTTLIQRSNDYITAGYINKIQYVALQMMIAGHLGYKVGKFCHLTTNLHVYDRHFDALEELLERTSLDVQPQLILKENKNFYDYTINDFEIIGIEGIEKIKSPLELAI